MPEGHPPTQFHAWVWLTWLTTTLLCVSMTRNPLYLVVIWLCVAIVHAAGSMGELNRGSAPFPFWLSLSVVPLGALFNALSVHVGETVIWIIPGKIPLVSGRVTWEAVVYGAINGLALGSILLIFWVFNQNVAIASLMRHLPRAFHSLAIVSSIALTFIPSLQREYLKIQEAQAIRGNPLSSLREKLASLLPLLTSSLERAYQLAEVMSARGFLQNSVPSQQMTYRIGFLSGVLFLLVGWLSRFWGSPQWISNLFLGVAVLLIAWLLILSLRHMHFTVYRSTPFQCRDALAIIGSLLALLPLILGSVSPQRQLLSYTPYPLLHIPPFEAWVALPFFGILSPFLVSRVFSHDSLS